MNVLVFTCLGHVLLAEAGQGPDLADAGVIAAQAQALRPHARLEAAGCLVIRVVRRLNQIINALAGGPAMILESIYLFNS